MEGQGEVTVAARREPAWLPWHRVWFRAETVIRMRSCPWGPKCAGPPHAEPTLAAWGGGLRARGSCFHLPSGLNASDDAQIHHSPADDQADEQPPLDSATVADVSSDVQHLLVPEVAHGTAALALCHKPCSQRPRHGPATGPGAQCTLCPKSQKGHGHQHGCPALKRPPTSSPAMLSHLPLRLRWGREAQGLVCEQMGIWVAPGSSGDQ